MKILTEATPTALWYEAVHNAEEQCRIMLSTDLESYLVYMLMRYICYQKLAKELMAENLLKGIQYPAKLREVTLQNVGDQCLLITGLFPALAEKRQVKLRYYIELGQIAYEGISRKNNDIFSSLSRQFIPMMDVLQSFRPSNLEPLPLEVRQIWEDPGQKGPKDSKY